jgi:predicted TPR repeat methyltransferase
MLALLVGCSTGLKIDTLDRSQMTPLHTVDISPSFINLPIEC